MFKALMYAVLLGLVELGIWLWKKRWWVVTVLVILLLWHYQVPVFPAIGHAVRAVGGAFNQ